MANEYADYPYEGSDEASENELLNESLSVWKGSWTTAFESREDFVPIPLDLHTACSLAQFDCVRNYIQRGADVNTKNKGGWTPLMYACYIGNDNIVNLLLDAKVDVNTKNLKGRSPLMLAASCGNESVSYFLLQQGADLEARDNRGWTALFHATFAGHQNLARFLLEKGADINTVEPGRGFTPFLEAAAEGHEIIVQYFLQYGANNHVSNKGETARSLALCNGHMKVVSLIDNFVKPAATLRSEPGLGFEGDLSSSDEAFHKPRSPHPSKGPSIRDGPEAFAQLMDRRKHSPHHSPRHGPSNKANYQANVPSGYVTFQPTPTMGPAPIRLRDAVSPIQPEDHCALDSSGRSESQDEEGNVFSLTGALTIKSSSSSSGGLAAAFGVMGDGQLDEPVFDGSPEPKDNKPKNHNTDRDNETDKRNVQNGRQSAAPCSDPTPSPPEAGHPSHDGKSDRPQDITAVLEQIGLLKYLPTFVEEDVDLQVFLSLTDNDLKEVGIKLFGPRRKMTNFIARWHSEARPACNDIEQSYADRLEAEMQEMAIQLHKASTQMDKLKVQAGQERELRSVAEACLMEDKVLWQQVHRIAHDTMSGCKETVSLLQKAGLAHEELLKECIKKSSSTNKKSQDENVLSTAIKQGLNIKEEPNQKTAANSLSMDEISQLLQSYLDEVYRSVTITMLDIGKLLQRGSSARSQDNYRNGIDFA